MFNVLVNRWCLALIGLLLMLSQPAFADQKVLDFRMDDKADRTRFVLEMSDKADVKVFVLPDPYRVVIDLQHTVWTREAFPPSDVKRIVGVRHSEWRGNHLRVVLDANQPINVAKHFFLEADDQSPHRLVVDIVPENQTLDAFVTGIPAPVGKSGTSFSAPLPKRKYGRKAVIVIDPGHGGKDPGAIGRSGKLEKHIVLAVARLVKKGLLEEKRYEVHMTRDSDRYIELRERVRYSERRAADLFVSLHADAHKNRNVQGLSVYTLSEKASDREAAALARAENAAGLVGNIKQKSESGEVEDLLINLVQRGTKNVSASFAETLIKELKTDVKLLRNTHRYAGFRVLTSAQVPSVLVELGYLSNRTEEKKLRNLHYRKTLASAIVRAINKHFEKYPVGEVGN